MDSNGYVYVVDNGNHRIQKFESDGTYVTQWGSYGTTGDGYFNSPIGVAVDADANVYVSDSSNNRMQKFDSSGGFLTKWGALGTADGEFDMPSGVEVDADGNVYVADRVNRRIQVFGEVPTIDFRLELGVGWNLISVPVIPGDTAVETVFWDSVVVYTWDADTAAFVRVQAGGALTDVEPGGAYWVKVTDEHDGTLTVLGAPVTADAWTVHLYEGWNMIGGPYSATAISKNDLYDDGAGALQSEHMYWWDPDGQYVDEDELEQGKGYWIAATGDCDLIIQASS